MFKKIKFFGYSVLTIFAFQTIAIQAQAMSECHDARVVIENTCRDKGGQCFRGHVYVNGNKRTFMVSPGKRGNASPEGTFSLEQGASNYWPKLDKGKVRGYSIYRMYKSKKYKAPMPNAVFFRPGLATHTGRVNGTGLSHGCIRMTPEGSNYVNQVARCVVKRGGDMTFHIRDTSDVNKRRRPKVAKRKKINLNGGWKTTVTRSSSAN